MVEPQARTSPQGGAVGPDRLLATKLQIPRTRPGFVPRPRLLDRLTEGLATELTLVCAPAGFGKTALLADWARSSQRPVAWLSLDEGDNDPARCWRHIAAALGRTRPEVGEQVVALLEPPAPQSLQAVATVVVNELAAQPDELVLVLDDYHLIEAPTVHDSLAFLLEHLPPELRLVLASRADPPLPLARLRGRGQLSELRAADLRFTAEEAAALLRAAVGPGLPQAAVAALTARTEGWGAGLQLAALSLQGRSDVVGFVETFTGSHRYILDYLAEEVLDRQPERLRGFLLETSVLERLSGELCDAVTGRTGSQALLEALERANLFLVPLDDVRGWYRYHQLFADLLRVRLAQERPDRLPGLHRAAAARSEQHGLVDDAIRHALAAGDAAWATRLVEQHLGAVMRRGEVVTLDRWLAALPQELVRSRPRLCLAQAYRAMADARLDAFQAALDDVERALATSGDAEQLATAEPAETGWEAGWLTDVPGSVAALRADLARLSGDPDATRELALKALARLPEESGLRTLAGWNLARAQWLRGELVEAERGLADVMAAALAAGERHFALLLCWDLGRVQLAQGGLRKAAETYRQGLARGIQPGRPATPAVGIVQAGLAEVLHQRDELDAALDHVVEGVARCRQLANTRLLAESLVVLARIRLASGDLDGAMEAIGEAGRAGPSPNVVDLFNPAPVERARLLLARGEVAEAAAWAAERGLAADDEPTYAREREQLVLARLLLAQQAPDLVVGLLGRLHDLAVVQGRVGSVIEIRALQALALQASGDQNGALAALTEALALAAPEGCVRVLVDEAAPMAALLGKLDAAQRSERVPAGRRVPPEFLSRVRGAARRRGGRPSHQVGRKDAATAAAGLVEPLTGRELEVLLLLAVGASNRQIAEELVVARETVKKHVTHILDKLGAANRTRAVARARQLGLLE